MIESVYVPDVSFWQGNINEEVMLSRNILGLIIRIGSINKDTGECYKDYLFEENVSKFYGEVPLGGYWYFRPEHSGVKQSEYILECMNEIKQDFGAEFHLPINADAEENAKNVSKAVYGKELDNFWQTLINEKHFVGSYTRGYFWNDHIAYSSKLAETLPLNIARYSMTAVHPWNNSISSPLRPYPWNDFWAWQFSADGNGLGKFYGCDSDSIDLNKLGFYSVAEFHKFANWNQEPLLPLLTNNFCKIIHTIKGVCDRWLAENC